jgi:hypothetical protein
MTVSAARPLPERDAVDAAGFAGVLAADTPVVLRGQVARWPAVTAAREGRAAAARYLAGFASGPPVNVMVAPPETRGRFFYRDDFAGFNFRTEEVPVRALLGELIRLADDPAAPSIYAGSAPAAVHLPGWGEANPLGVDLPGAEPRVWIGNATRVSTHYDGSPNLACVVAGRRRFLLFPPEQLGNLYVGPLDRTMAGQASSMVDPDAPDLDRYPRFAEAMAQAMVAELEPGDAIFMPALWWHNVRADAPFNVLVNYWGTREDVQSPFLSMVHAIMALRDLPERERAVWRGWFDHYVFEGPQGATAHLPPAAQGMLGPPNGTRSARIRDYLARALSRSR